MMAYMGRSLFAGFLAWMLGCGSLWIFPHGNYHLDRFGDWVSMLLFQPLELLLSLSLFVGASWLLYGLIRFHIGQWIRSRVVTDMWLHVSLGANSLFLFFIQFLKMPVPTMMVTAAFLLHASCSGIRRNLLRKKERDLFNSVLMDPFLGKRRL